MATTEYQDYFQFEWDVVVHSKKFVRSKIFRFVGLTVTLILSSLVLWILNNSLGFRSLEFFWTMLGFVLLILIIIGIFWQRISVNLHQGQVYKYKISQQGFKINNKNYLLNKFKKAKIAAIADKFEEKLDEKNGAYVLSVPIKRSNLNVYFSEVDQAKHLLKCLDHYLK